jgi:hypothetical protein
VSKCDAASASVFILVISSELHSYDANQKIKASNNIQSDIIRQSDTARHNQTETIIHNQTQWDIIRQSDNQTQSDKSTTIRHRQSDTIRQIRHNQTQSDIIRHTDLWMYWVWHACSIATKLQIKIRKWSGSQGCFFYRCTEHGSILSQKAYIRRDSSLYLRCSNGRYKKRTV